MAAQMIDTILSAEKECDKRLNDASAKAAAIRADAAKKQAEILADARKQAAEARSRVLKDAEKEAERIRAGAEEHTAESVRALKDSVRRRSGAAVNAVAELLMQIS